MFELVEFHHAGLVAGLIGGRVASMPVDGSTPMGEFLKNVLRYPRYLVALSLGILQTLVQPLAGRRAHPVTAVAVVGALVSGLLSLGLVLRAMVAPGPLG
jgi:hypothetical protein